MSEPAAATEREEGYDHLFYARGFLIADGPEAWAPEGWTRRAFGPWTLRHDPLLAFAEAAGPPGPGPETAVAALGVVLDAERPEEAPEAVLARLAVALARSEAAFLEALDPLAGRHVLLARTGGRTLLVGDAAGTKQVFHYARERRLAASHARLVARNAAHAEPAPEVPFRFGYPGLATPWRHVRMLTPNALLRLDDMAPERFWPRAPIEPRGVEEVAEETGALMAGTLRHLAQRHRLRLSVTAGLDSRVALALTAGVPAALFTFYRNDTQDTDALDRAFARALEADTGRRVRVLYLKRPVRVPETFRDVLAENTVGSHQKALAWGYFRAFPQDGRQMHVRSNISEVGREFYGSLSWPGRPGAADLARLYLRGRKDVRSADVETTTRLFREFAGVTGLLGCGHLVDLRSLFYWEHRMAAWYGNLVTESDAAIDTVSPYNCRRVLVRLLAVPRKDRAASAVHRRIVAERAPELTRYPVNGRTLWP